MRGGDRPYHAVINGENYHALQLLVYLYEGHVDALYVDSHICGLGL
jgi:adenine-specific DNA-methyltransferase